MSSCATNSINSTSWAVLETVPVLKQRLALWTGKPSDSLYKQIGKPTETGEDESGNTVLIYLKTMQAPDHKQWHCKVSFTTNATQEIISTRLVSRTENVWGAYMPCVHIIQAPESA